MKSSNQIRFVKNPVKHIMENDYLLLYYINPKDSVSVFHAVWAKVIVCDSDLILQLTHTSEKLLVLHKNITETYLLSNHRKYYVRKIVHNNDDRIRKFFGEAQEDVAFD